MNKKIKYLIFANTLLLLALAGYIVNEKINAPKTAFIELSKVFDAFKYKTDGEAQYNSIVASRQRVLDSLEADLIGAQRNNDENKAAIITEEYITRQSRIEEENNVLSQEITKKVWSQLTQYIMDYAKAENYSYVFGGNGDGSLMYGDEKNNITKEVIEYVNNRYDGENK